MIQTPPISTEDQQDISEILRKIRKIELKTRGLVRESIGGEYHSCFKGEGIDFEDFREYQHGDEVRSIDWNVTARMRKPFIKKFTEQRELTMILAVDISASGNYGSHYQSKRELIAEVSALLAFSALQNKDKVGLILFTDQIEKYVPPQKGATHTLRLIREILYCHPAQHQTQLEDTIDILRNHLKRRSLVFLISDFLFDDNQLDELKTLSRQHDLVGVQISDPAEKNLPAAGSVRLEDPETGEQVEINTSNPRFRQAYRQQAEVWQEQLDAHFLKLAIDKIDLVTDEEYLPALHSFFKRRGGFGR